MRILFSVSPNPTLSITAEAVGSHEIVVSPRASDWGKSGWRKQVFLFQEGLRVMLQARRYDGLVVCTVGIEAFIIGRYRRLICPNTTVICADFLMPRESRLVHLLGHWLTGLDSFVCIRRADIAVMERRFAVPPTKCHFAYFPVNPTISTLEVSEGDYIYSAGWAHRDWPTLIQALSLLPYKAIISAGVPVDIPELAKDRITVLPMQSPEDGRYLMANAKLIVLSLEDTELPSGPLVLLDAMAAGKAVVATNVNGTRDYVENGKTGVLVMPANAAAMASAIDCLMNDDNARQALGSAARSDVFRRFTARSFIASLLDVLCAVCPLTSNA